ncbi:MAG: insulinase family protein [Deltaproteobacteria bacterium]|nr:insulinase family protein [Deltaproteobacteria bacterium]
MALLLLFWSLLTPAVSRAGLQERVSEEVLANGLKVILLENHKAPLVTFQVWYRVGSRNEAWGKTGLSHMLEHMMFKGTGKVGPEEFSRIIQENGGNTNAFTSRDYTAYFENLGADRIQVALELESDRMQNLILREKDFQTERMVVMEERRLRTEDNPRAYLLEQVEATAFQTQPYHWPVIGWMQDITRFTLSDLEEHYRTYYNPANAFLVVVGDFEKAELLPKIENTFGPIPGGVVPDQERGIDPPQTGERRVIAKREARTPFVVMAYHVPNLRERDSYVLEVISALLSEGKSSRLYQTLVRKERLALSVETDHSLLSRDPNLFYVSAEPLPGKEPALVEEALAREIERLQAETVEDRELEKAKNQIEASFVFGQDSPFFQAMLLAWYEIALTWRAIDDYLVSIRSVTPQEIKRVARRYLIQDNRTVGILVPLHPEEGKARPPGSCTGEQTVR